jgi:hypothetical protein
MHVQLGGTRFAPVREMSPRLSMRLCLFGSALLSFASCSSGDPVTADANGQARVTKEKAAPQDGFVREEPLDPCFAPWRFDEEGKLLSGPAACEGYTLDPGGPVTDIERAKGAPSLPDERLDERLDDNPLEGR